MERNDVERSWRASHALVQQTMMARTLRLFIAVTLPAPLRQALSDTQARLRRDLQGVAVGWSRIEGVHLTLKFLGDIEESRVDAIGRCITDVARTWSPVHLELSGDRGLSEGRTPKGAVVRGARRADAAVSDAERTGRTSGAHRMCAGSQAVYHLI